MSVGRVEMDDGRKQYIPYANLGAEGGSESEYVYIERFIRTETLLEKWNLTDAGGRDLPGYTEIRANMYNAVTGEYLGKMQRPSNNKQYEMRYTPLSFITVPYSYISIGDPWPVITASFGTDFFANVGVYVNLMHGVFIFRNVKKLSECPLYTWYKSYHSSTDTQEGFKGSYPAFLFRALLKKIENSDPMFLDTSTKKLADAESTLY